MWGGYFLLSLTSLEWKSGIFSKWPVGFKGQTAVTDFSAITEDKQAKKKSHP